MTRLVIFGLLCTALYYIVARAEATRWAWSRLDHWPVIGAMLRCPACSGFWLGMVVYPCYQVHPSILGQMAQPGAVLAHGLMSCVLVAVLWGVMHWCLAIGTVTENTNGEE